MRKVVCSGYTPQSNICNDKQHGMCVQSTALLADVCRMDLQFRCPRQPFMPGRNGKSVPRYVRWVEVKQ